MTDRKQHTENQATGRALCGRALNTSNHGYSCALESCQACANAAERARELYTNGTRRA